MATSRATPLPTPSHPLLRNRPYLAQMRAEYATFIVEFKGPYDGVTFKKIYDNLKRHIAEADYWAFYSLATREKLLKVILPGLLEQHQKSRSKDRRAALVRSLLSGLFPRP